MIFNVYTSISVGLIALTLGTFLLLWTCKAELCCKMFGKVIGIVVVTLSIISILLSVCHGTRIWKMERGFRGMGYMNSIQEMDMGKMDGKQMRKDCPMMKKMMMDQDQDDK